MAEEPVAVTSPANTEGSISATGRMLLATAGLVLLVAVFVWNPLTHGGYYSAADLLQEVDLLRVHGAHEPANKAAAVWTSP